MNTKPSHPSSLFVMGSLFDPYVLVSYCQYDICIFSDFDRSQHFSATVWNRMKWFNLYHKRAPLQLREIEDVSIQSIQLSASLPLFSSTEATLDATSALYPSSWAKKLRFEYGGMQIAAISIAQDPLLAYDALYQNGRKAPNILVRNDLPCDDSYHPSPDSIWDRHTVHANNNGYYPASKTVSASYVLVG
ncbi:MAG: hypothetical protein VX278_00635 [Myxococcota bacterium]|nr:hypothetical protein [Myxococcota bacterium]